jgi:hypothetical protein
MNCLQRYRQQRTDDHAKSQILKQLNVELFPNGSSHPASQIKRDLPPDFVLVTPIAAKTQKQQSNVGGWVLWSGRGQLRETGSTPAAATTSH